MSTAPFDDEQQALDAALREPDAPIEAAGPSLLTRMAAEAVGTFVLVIVALGVGVFSGVFSESRMTVALGFGVALWILVVAIGRVSGAHVNPAVTVGVWIAGRFPGRDVAPYILAQVVGATAAGATLWALVSANPNVTDGTALMDSIAVGYGDHSPTQFGLGAGLVAEVIGTALFVAAVLAATSVRAVRSMAPATIGFALFLMVMWTIPFTNAAINPARATGVALFADTWALTQLWLFWVAPLVGAAIVGVLFRAFGPEEDLAAADATLEELPEDVDAEA